MHDSIGTTGAPGAPSTQTPALSIRLFGALDLRAGDRSLSPLTSGRAETLLAYLVLHRQAPQSRQHLAFLLWPDSSESQARTNLRHVLHDLRHALPDADRFIEVTSRTLQWRPEAPFWLDVDAFATALDQADESAADGGLAALREAVETYAGDLLEESYEEWASSFREELRARYLDALERLATRLGERGDVTQAIGYAARLVQHDPLNEAGYRLLMRLYAASGQHARALQVYHRCSATLERELGVEPSPETREVYEALLSTVTHRTPAAETVRFAPVGGASLIGRATEWAQLTTLWRETTQGRAQVVLLAGEPGAGKTRLVEEFQAWCARHGAVTAEARLYAAEGATAYGPLIAWLRSDAFRARLGRLGRSDLMALAPLLPDLIRPAPDGAELDPGVGQRQRLFAAAARALLAPAGPTLLVIDDIQWSDPETLQFLHYLIRAEPHFPLLVAATARREEIDERHPVTALVAGLHALECFAEIEIGRLSQDETALLAEELVGESFDAATAGQLFRETEGNPLFVVEALRAGWRADAGQTRISPKVQAVIETRLAQLSDAARNLVAFAATIGREFTPEVLADASDADDETLVHGLDELWRRRIIREQGAVAYDFSHDKIREVAYRALSPARRRHHHFRVASALERRNARDLEPVSGQIAAHYEQAAAVEPAIAWYERAAQAAQQRHAYDEAVRSLSCALDLLRALPDTPERASREMAMLAALPASLGLAEGFSSRRLAGVHRRAEELAEALGVELAPQLLRSRAIASLSQSDFVEAHRAGEQLRARGERDADDVLLVESDYVLGIAAFWQGEFEAARKHFAGAVSRYQSEYRRAHLVDYGLDPKVLCQSRLGNALWFLGRFESAIQARDNALRLADEIGHPYSRATARVFAAMLTLELGDLEGVRAYADLLMAEHSEREGWPTRFSTEAIASYVDVATGRDPGGFARIERLLDETEGADHAPGMHAVFARLLLEACKAAGDAERGLAAAERALAITGSRLWEAEARRQRAEYLDALGASWDEVEAELGRALGVARRQGAAALELRAAASWVRLQRERGAGPTRAARAALRTALDQMPEGRESPEFREAALLG
jgi:DNA-binding SARP family transcriptional activator